MVDLSANFYVDDSYNKFILIRKINSIKFKFVSMFHCNFRYFKYLIIINYIGFKLFILTINLDIVPSSNIFNILVFVLRYNGLLF